ncbi:Periplasmic protein TonB [Commensalibacter communis]|uniref:energy transducer TonB family protein n=1 Tax=Commensalibacter communis TaxID=2972786 RepID=UPI0022FFACB0|nr:energy transducer TonB [Commensalibacter communis]CAI3958155.1 Periplasmic protein TonB [Commensalibacter communis]
MSSSFFQLSLGMNKQTENSFAQWQKKHELYQQKQDRLLWGGALIGTSILLVGIAWLTYDMPHTKTIALNANMPPAITLDLSTDFVPPAPPPMAAQPEPQPLEEAAALDAPVAPSAEINLPKTQQVEKIKPVEQKKIIKPQPKIVHAQKVMTTPSQTVNNTPSASNAPSSSASNSPASSSTSSASSHQKSSMSPATWQGNVLAKLERLKRYPTDAQNDKQEGTATIKITINRQGHVLASKLAKSSGYSLLDKEAVALAYRADPLPSVPESIKGNSVTITVPVEFNLS